jgi:hypothetical protein
MSLREFDLAGFAYAYCDYSRRDKEWYNIMRNGYGGDSCSSLTVQHRNL